MLVWLGGFQLFRNEWWFRGENGSVSDNSESRSSTKPFGIILGCCSSRVFLKSFSVRYLVDGQLRSMKRALFVSLLQPPTFFHLSYRWTPCVLELFQRRVFVIFWFDVLCYCIQFRGGSSLCFLYMQSRLKLWLFRAGEMTLSSTWGKLQNWRCRGSGATRLSTLWKWRRFSPVRCTICAAHPPNQETGCAPFFLRMILICWPVFGILCEEQNFSSSSKGGRVEACPCWAQTKQ